MNGEVVQVLVRKSQVRPQDSVRDRLREEMEDRGVTAKELAREIHQSIGYPIAYRTIQNAMNAGNCSLDTFMVFCAFFGWDFADEVLGRFMGASRLETLEREIAHEKAIMAGREARLARLRAADRARGASSGGFLRLVPEEDRLPSA